MELAGPNERPLLTEPARTPRIAIDELPFRERQRGDDAIDITLRRLGAAEGSACQLDCDCRIGLVCAQGICSEKD
jgi:hypothetical protein